MHRSPHAAGGITAGPPTWNSSSVISSACSGGGEVSGLELVSLDQDLTGKGSYKAHSHQKDGKPLGAGGWFFGLHPLSLTLSHHRGEDELPCIRAAHPSSAPLELFPLAWKQLSSLLDRIFEGEPNPLHRKML
jgi:hypothetical protein